MNYDELAFFNQQLAGMLKSGIPLEGALRQLCETMQRGALRSQIEALGADLAKGVPLREALPRRELPGFYVQMLQVGAQGNDLPRVLTMVADHYQRVASVWARLKALMVYPALVYGAMLGLFGFLGWLVLSLAHSSLFELAGTVERQPRFTPLLAAVFPFFWLVLLGLGFAVVVSLPAGREWLRRRLPGFREANLARFASGMKVLLQGGRPLPQAVELMQTLEEGSHVGNELANWRARLAAGRGKLAEVISAGKVFPPLFVWLVTQGGEDLAGGFGRAEEIYYGRAKHRIEMMLYAALPVAVLTLGVLIVLEIMPIALVLTSLLNALGSFGD
jgi:general secretion pathway protein F